MLFSWRGAVYVHQLYAEHVGTSGVWHVPVWPFDVAFALGLFCTTWGFVMTIVRDLVHFHYRTDRYAPREKSAASVS
jgi:hypothetical protein